MPTIFIIDFCIKSLQYCLNIPGFNNLFSLIYLSGFRINDPISLEDKIWAFLVLMLVCLNVEALKESM